MILTISIPITFKKSSSSQPNQRIIVVGFLPFFLILINICQELSYNKVVLCSAAYQVNAHKSHKKVGGVQNPWCIVWTKKVFFFQLLLPEKSVDRISIYLHQSNTFVVFKKLKKSVRTIHRLKHMRVGTGSWKGLELLAFIEVMTEFTKLSM